MSTEPFIGEVKLLGFNFAPLGYMTCQGQLLSIAQYTALFSLMGTTYGGDGQQTFGLPDLQGRQPIGQGQGPGLPYYTMGEEAGINAVSLVTSQVPQHIHTTSAVRVQLKASNAAADENNAQGLFPANAGTPVYSATPTPQVYTGHAQVSGTTDIVGSGVPFPISNPFLVMNYSIAIEGIFPSRN